MIDIRVDDPHAPAVAALLAFHLADARAHTPAENAHALGAEALAHPDIIFFTAWRDDALAGMAALKALGDLHGEVKSMRTAPDHLRCGVARALLDRIVAAAHERGFEWLSLETGTAPNFDAANAFYEAAGFVDGPVFGGYPASPHNRFMTKPL